MSCAGTASTGLPVLALLSLAVLCVLAGLVLVVLARRRRGNALAAVAVVALLLIGAATYGMALPSRAQAGPPTCPATPPPAMDTWLTILQTSTMTGLAPGVAPSPITGIVTNHGDQSTVVATVTVRIVGVTKAPGARAGMCDASDYVLIDATMRIGQLVAPRGHVAFSGASIGFNDKSVNQDACQRAVVHLAYTAG